VFSVVNKFNCMQLQKATIAELDENDAERDPFPVQFNPTTLRLTLNNRVEGNQSQGRQVRQFVGPSSTTLALDLIFDTADEGSSENPRSVREKTRQLERFITPRGSGQQENAPPRLRFTWGDLVMDGVVDSLTIDFDHFAANGAPLRAKVTLSIQGQDRDRELNAQTDGRAGAGAPGLSISGGLGIGLGASIGVSASVGVALGGESGAEFAARVGVDAAAWRGLELGGESSLSLSAGAEIGFNANLNASAGLGVTIGPEAGASASPEASFGLESNAGLNAVAGVGVGAELASGFALSSAGGVTAALESVQNIKNQTAANQSRDAFKVPAKSLPASVPKLPEQKRTPLKNAGLPSASAQASTAPLPPRADARASSFGSGVPLRPTINVAIEQRSDSLQGGASVKSKVASGEPPVTNGPTMPAWVALPARNRTRMKADKVSGQRRPKRPCGCAGGCKH
jgi:hypothetical protein